MSTEQGPSRPENDSRPLTPFHRNFDQQVQRVQFTLLLLVAVIVVIPVSVYTYLEVDHLNTDMARHASDTARDLDSLVRERIVSLAEVESYLEDKIATDSRIASICVLSDEGTEPLCVTQASSSSLLASFSHDLDPSLSLWTRLEVRSSWLVLLPGIARVFVIHCVVASLLGLLIHWVPIRALSRARRKLEATQAQLFHAEKLNALGEIYAGIAHEINNPLSIILSRVELLRDSVDEQRSPSELKRELDVLRRHTTRIGEITRGLLTFAQKTQLQMSDTDINALIQEVVQFVDKPFSKQGITIETVLGKNLPTLTASHDHLQQVMLNLLNNSRDAMPRGGKIDIRTFRENGLLVAEVTDTGTGIAKDLREAIFEPFFTTKGKGTGLGLSVSYGIIDAHSGELELESEPGAGARFRIKLPLEGSRS